MPLSPCLCTVSVVLVRRIAAWSLLAAVGLLTGCGTFERHPARRAQPAQPATAVTAPKLSLPGPDPVAVPARSEPVPAAAHVPDGNDAQTYRIQVGDTIHVLVTGEDDLSGDFKVAVDGMIVYSLLGRVPVQGFTATMVESNLTAALAKDYLVNPRVFVQVRTSVMRRVVLFGEVKTPGVYELPVGERFTLLQVIAKSGGLTDLAATDRVRIVRRSGTTEQTIKVNVTDLLQGRSGAKDVELQPNDVITVPQTMF